MEIVLYGNGGSGNHGCEAIVRGTFSLLQRSLAIASEAIDEDLKYGLNKYGNIYNAKSDCVSKIQFIKAYTKLKLAGNYTEMDCLPYWEFIKKISKKTKLALSVGGDNYCYSNQLFYACLNRMYRKQGIKTVLWGCSIEPGVMQNKQVALDLKSYNLIVAREQITYQALQQIGAKVILAPDPAFYMQPEKCEVDSRFLDGNVIGINISPMIIDNEKKDGITYENYKKLLAYILDYTDMTIALIPHVVWKHNDDRKVLKKLYDDYQHNQRIIMIEDHNAAELKYIISKCRFFVGARTHATIAAYSSCVPTLVVGYSVKANGIATDIFGTAEHYVMPVQAITYHLQLVDAVKWLIDNEQGIKQHLVQFMPEYIKSGNKAKLALERV